tara:strand:- start:1731 stop:1979 length:249 start_codon:yes stop_codon:yes gene_type:complete
MTSRKYIQLLAEYPRKHAQGFTTDEIESFLDTHEIDKKEFNNKLGINTAMLIDDETVWFTDDIQSALRHTIDGTNKHWLEWD